MFAVILLGVVILLQSLVFREYRKFLNSHLSFLSFNVLKLSHRVRKTLLIMPFILFNLPYLYTILYHFDFTSFPEWVKILYIKPFFIFQSSMIFLGLWLVIVKSLKVIFKFALWIWNKKLSFKEKLLTLKEKKKYQKFDLSRRKFIRTSATAGVAYAFGASAYGVYRKDEYEISNIALKIPNLPQELVGTTVVLVSDIHSSPFMLEGKMKEYVEIINSLNPDIFLLPGDMTNSTIDEVHPFNKAFRDIKAKYGAFASLGNHDYFSDENYIAKAVSSETPLKMLRNNSEFVTINNKQLCIHGLNDTRASGAKYDPSILNGFYTTLLNAEKTAAENSLALNNIPQIMLCHKPYFFDEMSEKFKGLIVSGHTHGGQIVIAEIGKVNVSIAGTVSNYLKGLYKKNGSQMYITRGLGTVGLPIRLNCPPEITKITLV